MNRGMYKQRHDSRMRWVSAVAITLIAAAGAAPSTAPEDVVLQATDFTVTGGGWSQVESASGAGGHKLATPDRGSSATSEPLAHPGDYVEASFNATAGTAYRVWVRIRSTGDSKWNDSLWVQFSDSLVNGAPPLVVSATVGEGIPELWRRLGAAVGLPAHEG